jgi:hypothetical protein
VPDGGDTVSHDASLEAVQPQLVPLVVTVNEPLPAVAGTNAVVDESVKVHGAPSCVTVKLWPPAVIVPVRDSEPAFAWKLKVTVPVPVPDGGETVSHAAPLVAVQAQLVPLAVTVNVPLPAVAGTEAVVDESVNVHGTPACVTVNVWPPAVIVPVRDAVSAFAWKL